MKITFLAATISAGLILMGAISSTSAVANPSMHATTGNAASAAGNEGKVVNTMDSAGYTYMELENAGKRFWIASPTTKVKVGDQVRYVESMVMNNFVSKTLNRTFHKIIFVTSATVKN